MRTGGLPRRRGEPASHVREIVTPEGIPVRFELAGAADRAGGFLLDSLFQGLAITVAMVALWIATRYSSRIQDELLLILLFVVPNSYFVFFELRWQGATPGKRIIGTRVIDARGGQLENSAVLARNLVRELEVWVPLRFLLGASVVWPGAPGWALLLGGAWTIVFMLLPLFNRDRLRVGDLIAGTRVVMQPKTALVPDLVDERAAAAAAGGGGARFEFTEKQLGVYGIYELQVLEGLLRQDPGAPGYFEAVLAVTEKIRNKIGYDRRIDDADRFLRDFYAALRRHLEQRLLFGQRREDKHDR